MLRPLGLGSNARRFFFVMFCYVVVGVTDDVIFTG